MPWLVVIPINGRGAYLGSFLKLVREPLSGVGIRPPVGVRYAAVVAVGWDETVVDGRE